MHPLYIQVFNRATNLIVAEIGIGYNTSEPLEDSEMVKIVATEEQIRQLLESKESVEFVDKAGNRIGVLARNADLEDIKIARKRLASDDERLPFSAVLEHLSTLELP